MGRYVPAVEPDLASVKRWAGVEGSPLTLDQLQRAVQRAAKAATRPPVVLGVPSRGSVDVKWVQAMFRGYHHPADDLIVASQERGWHDDDECWQSFGTLVDAQRNSLCEAFLRSEFEWLLQWDDDVVFLDSRTDNVGRLLRTAKEYDAKIVSGVYHQKHAPYYPHLYMDITERADDPKRLYTPVTEYAEGSVIEVAGVGGGCLLIHRDVLESMADAVDRQWFTFRFGFGEDLAFCHQARQLGHRIYADTSVRLGHLTTECLHRDHYIAHQLRRTGENERKVVEAIADVKAKMTDRSAGMPTENVLAELHDSARGYLGEFLGSGTRALLDGDPVQRMADQWRLARPETTEEVRRFYETTNAYFGDLLAWNVSAEFARRIIRPLRLDGTRVADFGGGIGTLALLFARQNREVWHVDVPGQTRTFAEFRFKQEGRHVSQVPEGNPARGYIAVRDSCDGLVDLDLVTAIDVLEHIHPDEIDAVARSIAGALRMGGRFFHASSFGFGAGEGGSHPMHYDTGAEWEVALKGAGLGKFDDMLWMKEKRVL